MDLKSYIDKMNSYSTIHAKENKNEKKGYSEVLRKAVYGMLPINKLRDKVIKNLTISE
jgi:ribosomal protein L13